MTEWGKTICQKVPFLIFPLLCVGTLLCVFGFINGIIVSTLDKTGMSQLGHGGTVQEESRKMVCTLPDHTFCCFYV